MPKDSETLAENVAALEGQVVALRLMVAVMLYAMREDVPVESVYGKVSRVNQLFVEGTATLFPDKRAFFELGINSGLESVRGMAVAVGEIVHS